MIFRASLSEHDGEFLAECAEPHAIARGLSPQNALDNLRAEIVYRVELCPCTGVDDDFVQLEVIGGKL
jgi:hypothetical protein